MFTIFGLNKQKKEEHWPSGHGVFFLICSKFLSVRLLYIYYYINTV